MWRQMWSDRWFVLYPPVYRKKCSLILGLATSVSMSAVLEFRSSCFSSSCLVSSVRRQRWWQWKLREAEKSFNTVTTHRWSCLGHRRWRSVPSESSAHHAGLLRSELTQRTEAASLQHLYFWNKLPDEKRCNETLLTECCFGVSGSVQFFDLLLKFSPYVWWKRTRTQNQNWK